MLLREILKAVSRVPEVVGFLVQDSRVDNSMKPDLLKTVQMDIFGMATRV